MATQDNDKLADAMAQGQAQFDSIKEMVEALNAVDGTTESSAQDAEDKARQRIEEDALSVQVRSGWYSPGTKNADTTPAEYEILLCWGGPACRIVGTLNEYCEPETARLEVQDWGTPWAQCRPSVGPDNYDSEPILLAYAQVFWFGE